MKVEALDLTDLWFENDLREMFIDLDVDPGGADIMSGKGVYRLIYLRNIPRMLALVIKQEMLSKSGDTATPKNTLLGGYESTDIILIGNMVYKTIKMVTELHYSTKIKIYILKSLITNLEKGVSNGQAFCNIYNGHYFNDIF